MAGALIIAEAGVNHNGSVELAERMVEAAAKAGADAVKFQTFKAESLVLKSAAKAEYQKAATGSDDGQFGMLKKLELSEEAHVRLMRACERSKIEFLSTAFDEGSLELLMGLGVSKIKIPSGEINNIPFLRKAASYGRDVILSTGMSTLAEVKRAVSTLESAGLPRSRVTVLHCTTQYPAPFAEVNLRAMTGMGAVLGTAFGYSDHTPGIEVSVAAAALGASVLEKHFTLDKSMEGPDHKASLEPSELAALVSCVRHVEAALGDGVKAPSPSELGNLPVVRKSIVASRDIRKGERLGPENLAVKRPATGVSCSRWDEVVGTAAARDFKKDDQITLE